MLNIIFVCHGNICRSPMAEFLMKEMLKKRGLEDKVLVESAATSTDAIGCPVHSATKRILNRLGISTEGKYSVKLKYTDYAKYDYILGMDIANVNNTKRIFGGDAAGKIHRLLDFTSSPKDILDPWYTGDFEETYRDITEGLNAFFESAIDPVYINSNDFNH